MSVAALIQLTRGQVAIVDEEDYERLSKYEWSASWSRAMQSFYAKRTLYINGKRTTQPMHRDVLEVEHGDPRHVDHVNGNTLDNRKENLRAVTPRQNHENRKNQSKFGVGVYPTPSGRFRAQVHHEGKDRGLGTFDTPEEASAARVEFLASHGEEVLEKTA